MRRPQLINGLNNSQRIRVIVNGVGFYTTVQGAFDMPFTGQRMAVVHALSQIANSRNTDQTITGFASRADSPSWEVNGQLISDIEFQVDIV